MTAKIADNIFHCSSFKCIKAPRGYRHKHTYTYYVHIYKNKNISGLNIRMNECSISYSALRCFSSLPYGKKQMRNINKCSNVRNKLMWTMSQTNRIGRLLDSKAHLWCFIVNYLIYRIIIASTTFVPITMISGVSLPGWVCLLWYAYVLI